MGLFGKTPQKDPKEQVKNLYFLIFEI